MKLILSKEIDIGNARINISIDLKDEKSTVILSYTCSECEGYGCRRDNNCINGTIATALDPSKIDKHLDKESANKLRSVIQNLYSSMAG